MLTAAVALLAAALSAGNAEFERVSVIGAGEIAVARLKAEVVTSPCVTGVLEQAMLADPARFAARESARRAGAAVYGAAVAARLRGEVDALLAQLAGARPPEEVFGADFVRSARTLSAAEAARVLAGPYTNVFMRERQAACDAQARGLVASVRPPMSAVDGDDEAKIRRTLVANIAAQGGRIVFEENRSYVSEKLVEPLLADAKREKRRQQDYVRRVRSETLVPSALRADLAWKLAENVRARAEKTPNAALRWEVFPSVTNRTLDAAVEQRVLARLVAKAEDAPLGFDESSIRAAFAADPKVHRAAESSRAALRAAASAKLVASARAAVLDEADAKGRGELDAYLAPRLKSSELVQPLGSRLTRELDPLLARVRAAAAAQEFARRYPKLKDGMWYPEAELADRLVARSDFDAAVRAWRDLPELKAFGARAAFEETDRQVDRAVRRAFETARAAVTGQNATVDGVSAGVLVEARSRKESFFRRTPDLKAIVRMLTEATEVRWDERKVSLLWAGVEPPANAAEQHAELFPSVKRRIELVAREILDALEKPELPPEPSPAFSITVSRTGERVSVRLSESGKDVLSRETDAKLAPFRAAMKEVADKLGAEIMELK